MSAKQNGVIAAQVGESTQEWMVRAVNVENGLATSLDILLGEYLE